MRKFLIAALLSVSSLACLAGVDVNKASAADLDSIKGVGPSTSSKIIEARKTAPFKDWNDLVKRVPGIAEKRAVQLSAQGLTVNGEAYKPGYTPTVAKPADRKGADTKPTQPAPASSR
ncbi:helix-hairpin-helix domain-containing protein [Hydrogenophaga sp. IBVHS2]|uniref:ComEA family DNA-binding protein n=1 Tax=Hydrogenophaga sp. IBVHS2 TaxID=1985170 RepID=UPI000A2D12E6|nr:helix-hairpin-helix domain-containing protein [Hydrogenophaga sp. IBVHS2]OSZ62826.1 hypothetical protein CAP38_13755 [Hydrogenophaga sp. IBVHS2]